MAKEPTVSPLVAQAATEPHNQGVPLAQLASEHANPDGAISLHPPEELAQDKADPNR